MRPIAFLVSLSLVPGAASLQAAPPQPVAATRAADSSARDAVAELTARAPGGASVRALKARHLARRAEPRRISSPAKPPEVVDSTTGK